MIGLLNLYQKTLVENEVFNPKLRPLSGTIAPRIADNAGLSVYHIVSRIMHVAMYPQIGAKIEKVVAV